MPIGAITMILTNVGLQIYNNWCGSRQNKQLQQKREEFERAAKERNTQRMWQLMREGQELTKQLEEEKHQQRLEELKNDIGSLLQKLTYAATINNWPLNVLPIVMKNQALGNLLANQEESIALHCVFTPSNSLEFNRTVFPRIEETLEAYCNQHWSVMSDHPILFYSGAWKSQQSPSEVQIDSMRTALSNLPTLLITPFFRPNDGKLVFHVRLWGVGASSSDEFSIPEIEPTEFQRDYQTNDDYVNDTELMDELIEDLVPYLQCLIGYMADTYFWSALGIAPCLPKLLVDGTINTDGMPHLINDSREYYSNLLTTSEEKSFELPFAEDNLLNLYEGVSSLWDNKTKKIKLEEIFVSCYNKHTGTRVCSINDVVTRNIFDKEDLSYLTKFAEIFHDSKLEDWLSSSILLLSEINFDYEILKSNDLNYLLNLSQSGNAAAEYRLGELYEYSITVERNIKLAKEYYRKSASKDFLFALCKEDSSLSLSSFQEKQLKVLKRNNVVQANIILSQYYHAAGDLDKAIDILDDSDNDDHPFYLYLGAIFLKEKSSQKNKSLIESLLIKSAEIGYLNAQLELMHLYKDKTCFEENPTSHFKYANMAGEQGCLEAITETGLCLFMGYGTNKSIKSAIDVLNISAKNGNVKAKKLLSLINE